jgi:hypothetical protein
LAHRFDLDSNAYHEIDIHALINKKFNLAQQILSNVLLTDAKSTWTDANCAASRNFLPGTLQFILVGYGAVGKEIGTDFPTYFPVEVGWVVRRNISLRSVKDTVNRMAVTFAENTIYNPRAVDMRTFDNEDVIGAPKQE